MKILYLAKSILPSRTANSVHVMKMCQALAENGNEVWLCVLNEKNVEEPQYKEIFNYYAVKECFHFINIPIIIDKGNRVRFLLSHVHILLKIRQLLKEVQPELVYSRDIFSCFVAARAGYKVIAESHFPLWYGLISSWSFRFLYRKRPFKGLVVISEALRQVYLKHYPDLAPSKVIVAHDGADVPETQHLDGKKKIGRPGSLQVGYVGHLYNGKGIEVIEAIAAKMEDVDFHIIGGLEKDIARWKNRIAEANVIFHGFISQTDLPDYINALDVCLLPNQYKTEAFGADSTRKKKNISLFTSPLKMFEYMAHGKPIVASDLPVLREVLDESVAIFVQPDDFQGWISSISQLRDGEQRKEKGINGLNLLKQNYSWQKRADSILQRLDPACTSSS